MRNMKKEEPLERAMRLRAEQVAANGTAKAKRSRKRKAAKRRSVKITQGDGNQAAMRKVLDKYKKRGVRVLLDCQREVIGAFEHHSKRVLQKSEQELVYSLLASVFLGDVLREFARESKHDKPIRDYIQSIFTGKSTTRLRARNK